MATRRQRRAKVAANTTTQVPVSQTRTNRITTQMVERACQALTKSLRDMDENKDDLLSWEEWPDEERVKARLGMKAALEAGLNAKT